MTDKQYLSNLVLYSKIEASKDKSSAIREEFFDTAERKAAESLDNPTFDLYDRYMELAARAKANAFDNFSIQSLSNAGFSELIESTREGDAQRRRIWIAWIVAIDETYRQSRSA